MKMKVWILLIMGIWIGMIMSISFLEAPLKFRAPNMTLELGLGIGQLVFSALNKVEIFFSVLLATWLFSNYKKLKLLLFLLLCSLVVIVMFQSFWLLPILAIRASTIIKGQEVAKSYHHILYVVFELLKVALLVHGFFKIYNYARYPRQR